ASGGPRRKATPHAGAPSEPGSLVTRPARRLVGRRRTSGDVSNISIRAPSPRTVRAHVARGQRAAGGAGRRRLRTAGVGGQRQGPDSVRRAPGGEARCNTNG